jgi:RNA polymerase primary sigma factor
MRQLKITKSITNRESASLDKYLQEIGREDLITVEEEVELAQRIRKGDRVALEKLTRANLRFVVSVAKQYQNQGLSLPDLINEGNLGLIKAAEKFDETRGFKFISYAVWWIRQSILQALAEQSRIVRLPLNQVGSLNKISKAFSKFEQENERRPSPEELADELEIPVDKISDTLKVSGRHISVDAPFVEGEVKNIRHALHCLSLAQLFGTYMYYGMNRTFCRLRQVNKLRIRCVISSQPQIIRVLLEQFAECSRLFLILHLISGNTGHSCTQNYNGCNSKDVFCCLFHITFYFL